MTKQKKPDQKRQQFSQQQGAKRSQQTEQAQQHAPAPIIGQQSKRQEQAEQLEGQLQQERESGEEAFVRGEER